MLATVRRPHTSLVNLMEMSPVGADLAGNVVCFYIEIILRFVSVHN